MKRISLCTPCYNEEDNIVEIYNRVTKVMAGIPEYEYEYIFIDNKSTDSSAEILEEIAKRDKRIKVIINNKNFGPGRSGAHGFFQTSGDASIGLACDLQDPPEFIPEFIKKWEEGYKVVWGRKISSEENKIMFMTRSLYYKIIKLFSENKQIEHVTGFGLFDKEVVDNLRNENNPHPNFRYSITEFGYEVGLVDFKQPKREKGKSSYNLRRYLDAAIDSLVMTSTGPLRISTYAGILISFISFCIALYYLVKKLMYWDSFVIGTAPVVIGIFFLGAIQMIFIGILGEYLKEALARVTIKPLVIEEKRINFDE